MTTVKTTCARGCGDQTIDPATISVHQEAGRREGWYTFTCPTCHHSQSRPATPRTASVLLASGAEPCTHQPDPITEREAERWAAYLETVRTPADLGA